VKRRVVIVGGGVPSEWHEDPMALDPYRAPAVD